MLLCGLAAAALFTLSTGLTRPITALFAVGLGVPVILVGLFDTIGIAANALVRPLSGRLSDRHGRQPFMVGGLILLCTGNLLYASSVPSTALLLLSIGSVAIGIGAASFWPSFKASLVERFHGRRERVFGYVTATQATCTALGAAVGGGIATAMGIRWSFVASAVCLAAAAVLVGLSRERRAGQTADRQPTPLEQTCPEQPTTGWRRPPRGLLKVVSAIGLMYIASGATMTFLALYLAWHYGTSPAAIGVIFTCVFLGQAAGGLLIAKLADRISPAGACGRAPLVGQLTLIAAVACAGPVLPFAVFAAAQVVLALGVSASSVSLMTIATELVPPRLLGTAIGSTEAVALGAALLGPAVGGVVFRLDPLWFFPVVGALYALAALLVLSTRASAAERVQPVTAVAD